MSTKYLRKFIIENSFIGIDRIVPIGEISQFDLTWDGYNLHSEMTREISIK